MKSLFSIALLLSCYTYAQANDPFDKTQRSTFQTKHAPADSPSHHKCIPQQQVIAEEIPVNQLKIVGILQHKTRQQALFNRDQQLFMVSIGDVIAQEQLKVQHINKQAVQLSGWKPDCSQGEMMSIRF